MASASPDDRNGWTKPGPAHIPSPSFWPAGLAFGIALFVIGPAFEYVIPWLFFASGLLLMMFSLGGWILVIAKELRNRDE